MGHIASQRLLVASQDMLGTPCDQADLALQDEESDRSKATARKGGQWIAVGGRRVTTCGGRIATKSGKTEGLRKKGLHNKKEGSLLAGAETLGSAAPRLLRCVEISRNRV